jgi:type VI secretion system protein ImpB
MSTELQHWLDRNRPPRVQITYDVEKLGANVKLEIPFIGGIISDLSGDTDKPHISDRPFVEIDRDNFTSVMESLAPSLTLTGKQPYLVSRTPEGTTYAPDSTPANAFSASLAFQELDHFEPPAIIEQVGVLGALMDERRMLSDLMAKLSTTPAMEATLTADAAPLVMTSAKAAVDAANKDLTDSTAGAKPLFDAAAAAVVKAEGTSPRATTVTDATQAVANAVGAAAVGEAAATGYQKVYAAVAAPWTAYQAASTDAAKANAAAVALQNAGNAAWNTALVLRDAMKTVADITAGYPATNPPADQKDAGDKAGKAQAAVNKFVASAGTAALVGNSAAAVNPAP